MCSSKMFPKLQVVVKNISSGVFFDYSDALFGGRVAFWGGHLVPIPKSVIDGGLGRFDPDHLEVFVLP